MRIPPQAEKTTNTRYNNPSVLLGMAREAHSCVVVQDHESEYPAVVIAGDLLLLLLVILLFKFPAKNMSQ